MGRRGRESPLGGIIGAASCFLSLSLLLHLFLSFSRCSESQRESVARRRSVLNSELRTRERRWENREARKRRRRGKKSRLFFLASRSAAPRDVVASTISGKNRPRDDGKAPERYFTRLIGISPGGESRRGKGLFTLSPLGVTARSTLKREREREREREKKTQSSFCTPRRTLIDVLVFFLGAQGRGRILGRGSHGGKSGERSRRKRLLLSFFSLFFASRRPMLRGGEIFLRK